MKLVSEQSQENLAEQRALDALRWPIRELAANLLRVIRGAGRPSAIAQQSIALVAAFRHFNEETGLLPSSHDVSEMLDISDDMDRLRGCRSDELAKLYAENDMVRGALQVAASKLLHQSTQAVAGKRELIEGSRNREAALQQLHARMASPKAGPSKHRAGSKHRATKIPGDW